MPVLLKSRESTLIDSPNFVYISEDYLWNEISSVPRSSYEVLLGHLTSRDFIAVISAFQIGDYG